MKRILTMTLALLALGCGDDHEDAPPSDAGGDDGGSEHDAATGDGGGTPSGTLSKAVGAFTIELVEAVPATEDTDGAAAATSIFGRIYERAVPSTVLWDIVASEEECDLLEPRLPFCDPACTGGALCAEDGTCRPFPDTLDVGTVAITGLESESGSTTLMLEPLPRSNIYQPAGALELAYPPFAEEGLVTLHAEGGDYAPLTLTANAIAPLEVLNAGPVTFDPEGTTRVRWVPQTARPSMIFVRVDISHHGGQKGELICGTADDGELELPRALVQGLIDLGVAGFPTLEIQRVSVSEAPEHAPEVELKVISSLTLELFIPGFVSCTMPGEQDVCDEGELCQDTKLCP